MLNRIIVYLDIIVPLICFLFTIIFFKNRRVKINFYSLTLLLFDILQFTLNSIANILQNLETNNLWTYHLNSLFTQIIFSVYFFFFFKDKLNKIFVVLSFCIYLGFFTYSFYFLQKAFTFNSFSYAFGVLWIIFFSLRSFQNIFKNIEVEDLLNLKEFWIATGILFYFGSSFFIFLSYSYLSKQAYYSVGILWKIHNIFLSIGCFLFLKSIISKKWIQK